MTLSFVMASRYPEPPCGARVLPGIGYGSSARRKPDLYATAGEAPPSPFKRDSAKTSAMRRRRDGLRPARCLVNRRGFAQAALRSCNDSVSIESVLWKRKPEDFSMATRQIRKAARRNADHHSIAANFVLAARPAIQRVLKFPLLMIRLNANSQLNNQDSRIELIVGQNLLNNSLNDRWRISSFILSC